MNLHFFRSIHIVYVMALLAGLHPCSRCNAQQPALQLSPVDEKLIQKSLSGQEQLAKLSKTCKVPDWAYDARWYHVDIPRFSNGDRSNDPEGTLPWTVDWPLYEGSYQFPQDDDIEKRKEKLSHWYQSARKEVASREYGGDLQGLMHRLPYIKSLGVNTLYLGGILAPTYYKEQSFHGFHYYHIDDSIGVKDSASRLQGETADPSTWKFSETDKLFIELIKTLHLQDMRVVISSCDFVVKNFDDPKPQEVIQLMATTQRWMDPNGDGDPSDGVDGWALGFHMAKPNDLITKWKKRIKGINPDCVMVDQQSSISVKSTKAHHVAKNLITYDLREKLSKKEGKQDDQLGGLNAMNKSVDQLFLVDFIPLLNYLDQRKLTDMDLPELLSSYNGKPTAGAYDRWKLATILQHFLPGVPVTYYGDEVGMYGGPTPENARRPMWWNDLPDPKTNSPDYRGDFFALVKWLHEMRADYIPLRRGDFRSVMADDEKKIFAFTRSYKGEEVILLMNVGSEKQMVMLPAGTPGQIVATLSPRLKDRPARGSKTVDYTQIKTMHVGGVRQFVNKEGKIRIWVNPMSVRVVIVNQE